MTKMLSFVAALGAASALAFSAQAAPASVKAGVLTCNVGSGWGLLVGSHRELDCTFESGGQVEAYRGRITDIGLDLGRHEAGKLAWAVFAPSAVEPGALAGRYGGVAGGASLGIGGGANILVGGSGHSISLQPLSVDTETGLDVVGGVSGVALTAQ